MLFSLLCIILSMYIFIARCCILLMLLCGLDKPLLVAQTFQDEVTKQGEKFSIEQCLVLSAQKEQQGDYREASRWLNQAAVIAWEAKNYPKAIEFYGKSLKLNEKVNNLQGIFGINSNLGMIYADMGDYETAIGYFYKTLEGRKRYKDKVPIIAGLINCSVVLNNLKRYDESVRNLEEALGLAKELNDVEQMRSCYGMLAETYEKAGDNKQMMKYFELYRTFHEYLQNNKLSKVTQRANEAEAQALKLTLENKEKEIELLKQQQQVQEKTEALTVANQEISTLVQGLSKTELAVKFYQNLNALKETQLAKEKLQKEVIVQQDNLKTTWFTVGLLVAALLSVYLWLNNLQRKKHNATLLARNQEINQQKEEIYHQKIALEKQAEELQKLNQTKDKLFSIIAHDLRTPFANIKGVTDLLDMNTLSLEEIRLILRELSKNASNTQETLENLLLWAKSQLQGIKPNPKKVNSLEITEEVVSLSEPQATDKQITLHANVQESILFTDENHLQIILRNLLNNAIKFTKKGGKITLIGTISPDGHTYSLSVTDTGEGMSQEQLNKLFNPNTHFTKRGTNGEKGTGLGLLLCKEFIEQNNGSLKVQSQVGVGSTFTLLFKL